ncbi:MAG: hypothetical protein DRP09_10580 [Candidatus Thorarchaeota archaeon]|nr:MAG: hypothetical protein DRP09_10580 [Candidatus Thorarchaeota archaeon]
MNAEQILLLKRDNPDLLVESKCCRCGTRIPMETVSAGDRITLTTHDGVSKIFHGVEWCPKCRQIHLVEIEHRNDLEIWKEG